MAMGEVFWFLVIVQAAWFTSVWKGPSCHYHGAVEEISQLHIKNRQRFALCRLLVRSEIFFIRLVQDRELP